jgi:hypothetical protein
MSEESKVPSPFDENAINNPNLTTSAQTFNRIRAIKAVDGMVLVLVDDKRMDAGVMTDLLKPTLMSVREAAERAQGLNRMIGKLPYKSDKDTAFEIVEATMAACREAQHQKLNRKTERRAMHNGFSNDPKEILERAFPKEAKWTAALAKQNGITIEEMQKRQLSEIAKNMSQDNAVGGAPKPSIIG